MITLEGAKRLAERWRKRKQSYRYDPCVTEADVEEARPEEGPDPLEPKEMPKCLHDAQEREIEQRLLTRFGRPLTVRKIMRQEIPQLQIQDMETKKLFRIKPLEFEYCFIDPWERLFVRIQDRFENNRIDNGT